MPKKAATLVKEKPARVAPRPRHREGTEASLLAAVGTLLAAGEAPSVSAIAQAAGVDKALVYRYFGDLDGILHAYAGSALFWPTFDELAHDRAQLLALPFADRYCLVLRRYGRALRARPATIAILAAEMTKRSAWHAPIEASREAFGQAMFELTHDAPQGFDVAAVTSVLSSSIHYLLLRARHIAVFNGIAIRSDEGFERIERAIELLARSAVAATAAPG